MKQTKSLKSKKSQTSVTKYDPDMDYIAQLKRFQSQVYERNLVNTEVPKNKALVELFVFTPQVPEVSKGTILVPDGIEGNYKDLSATSDNITAKYKGPKPVVRVIKMGKVGKEVTLFNMDWRNHNLFSVPVDETVAPVTNPDYMQWYQFAETNKGKGTTEMKHPGGS